MDATIINRFAKCGDLCGLHRRFRSLSDDGRRVVVREMAAGEKPEAALKAGKRFDRNRQTSLITERV